MAISVPSAPSTTCAGARFGAPRSAYHRGMGGRHRVQSTVTSERRAAEVAELRASIVRMLGVLVIAVVLLTPVDFVAIHWGHRSDAASSLFAIRFVTLGVAAAAYVGLKRGPPMSLGLLVAANAGLLALSGALLAARA